MTAAATIAMLNSPSMRAMMRMSEDMQRARDISEDIERVRDVTEVSEDIQRVRDVTGICEDIQRARAAMRDVFGSSPFHEALLDASVAITHDFDAVASIEPCDATANAAADADMVGVLRQLVAGVEDLKATESKAPRLATWGSLYVAVVMALWTIAHDVGPDRLLDVLVRLLQLLEPLSRGSTLPS